MKLAAIRAHIIANAAELARLHARIRETAFECDASPIGYAPWEQACAQLLLRADTLAFPGGYKAALEKFCAGDESVVEPALCFLEVRPYFHRSGYMFGVLMRRVRRAALSDSQRQRLDAVITRNAAWKARKGRHHET